MAAKTKERAKEHGLDLGLQMQAFYNRVSFGAKQLIYASADGSTDIKTPQKVYDLIDQIAMNSYTWGSTRTKVKPIGVHCIDMITIIESRLAAMIIA